MSSKVQKLVKEFKFFESLIHTFAEDRLDVANDQFVYKHGYDLRTTDNSDHLVFSYWKISEGYLILYYKEVTPHDIPYGVNIRYPLEDLHLLHKVILK